MSKQQASSLDFSKRVRSLSDDFAVLKALWAAAAQEKNLLIQAFAYPLSVVLLATIVPLIISKTLAALVQSGDPMRYVPYLAAAALSGVLLNRMGFAALMKHQAKTMYYLQTLSLRALLRRSMRFHNDNVGGKLVSDAIDLTSGYGQVASAVFIHVIPFAITLLSGSIAVFLGSWQLGLYVVFMIAVSVGWGIFESRRRSGIRQKRLKASKDVTGHIADTVLNVQTVKTFAHEKGELARQEKLGGILLKRRLTDWVQAAAQGNNRMAALSVMQLLLVVLIIQLVKSDPYLLAAGIFAFSFSVTLSNRLFEVTTMLKQLEEGLLNAQPMCEIISHEEEIKDKPDARQLEVPKGQIDFRQVVFRYDDATSHKDVFAGLDFAAAPGEKIGLVGPSGGGKSTLTKLLLRFEDIQGGQILIDSQNIADVTQESLRQAIAYVPQEPLLFHRTIRDNIAYGNWEASLNDVKKAAQQAHAAEFIESLPNGYDTIVGERGVKLSGGQRQRIAIARAILKDAPILVLDEATSALDSESEILIQKALWQLMRDRTTIVIAHRLSTIRKMDRILVLENGRITEEGSHQSLLRNKATYAKLWSHQSDGFIEE